MQLVINTFGASLRKQGEQFLIKAGEKEFSVSAHKVQSILITTAAHLSTDAIQLACAQNIDLVFLSKEGEPYARIWQTRMGSTAAIRRRQLLEVAEGSQGLALAREWIQAKLQNQIGFLQELKLRRPEAEVLFTGPMMTIAGCLDQVKELTGTLEEQRGTLMGLEGGSGRAYFACLGQLVPESFRFEGRSRQPAKDEFNAILNYSYGMLYSLVEKACICAGLDPFVGFLHTDNYAKKSLVFDLIEPFRILGERAALLLFTGRRVKKEFFDKVPGGLALNKDGRALFISYFNERLDKRIRYPVQGQPRKHHNIKQRDIIRHEAHALANRLLGKSDLPRIVETRTLWEEQGSLEPLSLEDEAETQEEELVNLPSAQANPEVEPPC